MCIHVNGNSKKVHDFREFHGNFQHSHVLLVTRITYISVVMNKNKPLIMMQMLCWSVAIGSRMRLTTILETILLRVP